MLNAALTISFPTSANDVTLSKAPANTNSNWELVLIVHLTAKTHLVPSPRSLMMSQTCSSEPLNWRLQICSTKKVFMQPVWFIIHTKQFIKYYNKICFMFKNASSLLSDEMCISSPAIPNTACVAGSRKVQRCAGLTGFMSCTMRGITIILFCLHNNHTLWHFYPCIWKSVFYAKCLTPKQAFCSFFPTGLNYVTDAGFISLPLYFRVKSLICQADKGSFIHAPAELHLGRCYPTWAVQTCLKTTTSCSCTYSSAVPSNIRASPAFSGMKVVQRQAEPARHRKLAMLFLRPALQDETDIHAGVSE